ncbi:MAG: hypothetical protein HY908_11000 [Myxococcales bacterium]|nr:hypothetical protein [Myxococcales bacterium]
MAERVVDEVGHGTVAGLDRHLVGRAHDRQRAEALVEAQARAVLAHRRGRVGILGGRVRQALEEQSVGACRLRVLPEPLVERAADASPSEAEIGREKIEEREAQHGLVDHDREAEELPPLVLRDVDEGAQPRRQRVAQPFAQGGAHLAGDLRELRREDGVHLVEHRGVERSDVVVDAANGEHGLPSLPTVGRRPSTVSPTVAGWTFDAEAQ